MEKKNNQLHSLIKKRKSIVSFSDRGVDEKDIALLFEASRWAPSSRNQQPWRFIYALKEDKSEFEKLASLLFPANRLWAEKAPLLILGIAEVISDYKDRPNRFAYHDLGMAVSNLLFQATYMGLYVHPMGGYDVEKAQSILNIPERFEPAAMLAVGYHGEIDNLPVELKRRELAKRTRKEPDEFVFKGKWEGNLK